LQVPENVRARNAEKIAAYEVELAANLKAYEGFMAMKSH
jgi:hypothetical protein